MKKSTRNSAYTKLYNRKLITGNILRTPMSRADLSKKIGLTRAAITIIVDSLISEGIIIEKGTISAGMGRNPMILDVNPDCYYALGLNISRSTCSLGLVNIKGKVLKFKDIDLGKTKNAGEALVIIKNEIKALIKETDIAAQKLLGMGISSPGPLDSDKGIIINPPNFKKWENVAIVSELKKTFDFHITLENNASALAIAEKYYGAARNFSDFILLVVDTGVGAGIITNNNLYKGANSLGAELGHTSILYNGEKCSCGNNGCLEVYASEPAIVNEAKKAGLSASSWKEIVDHAQKGEEAFIGVIENESEYLSTSLVNVINLLGLEAVILAGCLTYEPKMLLEKIDKKTNALALNRNIYKTDILVSGLNTHSEIISAASTVFSLIL